MVSRVMKHFEEDGTLVERPDGSFVLTPRRPSSRLKTAAKEVEWHT